jgi:hypothetical protein
VIGAGIAATAVAAGNMMHDLSLICLGMLLGWFLTVVVIVVVAAPMRSSQRSRQEEAAQAAEQEGV